MSIRFCYDFEEYNSPHWIGGGGLEEKRWGADWQLEAVEGHM